MPGKQAPAAFPYSLNGCWRYGVSATRLLPSMASLKCLRSAATNTSQFTHLYHVCMHDPQAPYVSLGPMQKMIAPQGSLERPLDLRRLMSPEALKAASQHGLLRSPAGSGNAGPAIARTPSGQAAAVTQTERLAALQQLLTAFMEEAISHMAGERPRTPCRNLSFIGFDRLCC